MKKGLSRLNVGVLLVVALGFAWTAAALEAGQFDYREVVLENGLRVITLEDFSCPVVAVDLWYHVGSKNENPDRQGFAHMFEHMMFRGTDRLGPTSHFDYIRQTGGHCNGYTGFDQTVYVETLPANQLELALWLEAERMSFLKIDQAAFDTERKVVEEERRLGLNAPYGTLYEDALAEVFKVHPYRWSPIGKIPHLRASTVPELRAFWTQYYVPNNATLVIAGAVKHEDAQSLAKRYFEWIPKCPQPPQVSIHEPMPEGPREVTLKLENAPAPLVGVVYRTVPESNDDDVPITLLATILGDGASSRLYTRLVTGRTLGKATLKKELAVGVRCTDMSLEQDGVFIAGAGLQLSHAQPDKAIAVIKEEIENVRTKKVKPQELEKAKNQMLRNLVTENLYVANKVSILGRAAVLEGDTSRVNRRLKAIRDVTSDDLLRVAKQYLDPNRALTFRIESNLAGMLKKDKKNPEDDAPITGQPETTPPAPGRAGVERPADYPNSAPLKGALDFDVAEPHETRTLSNGLKVVVVENHEVPYVSIMLGLQAGAWTESKPGCCAMAMNMITSSTKKHSLAKLADEMDTYAISIFGDAGMDKSTVTATCVTDQLDRAMRLFGEVVLTPRFAKGELELKRREVLTGLAVDAKEPAYLASRELRRRLYGEHPYARTVVGQPKDVEALDAKDLKAWWSTFVRPDMACLYFAGDIDVERAVKLAESAFGSWKAKGPKLEVKLPAMPELGPTQIYLVDKSGDQSQIRIAQRGIAFGHPGYFTGRVVTSYFGGAFGSRLNESLRVKKGLTYGARGGYSTLHQCGEFTIQTFTKNATVPEAVQSAIDEIKRLQNEPPAAEELDHTKAYILGSFAGERETSQAVANDLWFIDSEGLPEDHFSRLLKGVQATDPNACVQLAQTTLDPSKLVIVIVGPADELKPKLEAIAPVTVVSADGEEAKAGKTK